MKNGPYKYLSAKRLRNWVIVPVSVHKLYIKTDTNVHKGRNVMKDGQYKCLPEKQLRKLGLCTQIPLCTLWKSLNIGLNSRSIFCTKKETKSLSIFRILPEEEKTSDMLITPAVLPDADNVLMPCPGLFTEANNSRIRQSRINMIILKRFSLFMARKGGH